MDFAQTSKTIASRDTEETFSIDAIGTRVGDPAVFASIPEGRAQDAQPASEADILGIQGALHQFLPSRPPTSGESAPCMRIGA